MLTFITYTFTF